MFKGPVAWCIPVVSLCLWRHNGGIVCLIVDVLCYYTDHFGGLVIVVLWLWCVTTTSWFNRTWLCGNIMNKAIYNEFTLEFVWKNSTEITHDNRYTWWITQYTTISIMVTLGIFQLQLWIPHILQKDIYRDNCMAVISQFMSHFDII